ncbi:helix-turn-helix domain-containing protein [Geodermatophilus ruber]|uniref:AraC-type DNA-binding protein n=1 Tax=Geodermatophilus ruber TaxID=504800 RepID=A0A1I4H471_9ACTN|nr:helix-turn-helix domain-containing protein [Geodermatophilus ruber]SFL37112.1 AraC-type DNA-binding protein [Geodermatophilus ruber]
MADAAEHRSSGDAAPRAPARHRVGDLVLVDSRCGPGRAPRAVGPGDVVGVLFVREGLAVVERGGVEVVVRPGSALLRCGAEPVHVRTPGRLHMWTLLVPSSRLPGSRSGLLDPAAAGLLAVLLETALGTAAALDGWLGQSVADAAVALLGGAPGPGADDAAWARVTGYVAAHLRDPGLDPPAIAAGAYLSVRSLYALFAARGRTPAGYVRRLRLEGAYRELVRSGTAVTVAAVAHGWGFRDQATFGRGFRAAFGRTPDEVRRGAGFSGRAVTAAGEGAAAQGPPGAGPARPGDSGR